MTDMRFPPSAVLLGTTLLVAGCGGSSLGSGESCQQLMDGYSSALASALVCTPGATNQCQQEPMAVHCCQGQVEDATTINAIAAQLHAQGCIPNQVAECPCAYLGPIACEPADGGGGVCEASGLPAR
jgi:hypothetical protein